MRITRTSDRWRRVYVWPGAPEPDIDEQESDPPIDGRGDRLYGLVERGGRQAMEQLGAQLGGWLLSEPRSRRLADILATSDAPGRIELVIPPELTAYAWESAKVRAIGALGSRARLTLVRVAEGAPQRKPGSSGIVLIGAEIPGAPLPGIHEELGAIERAIHGRPGQPPVVLVNRPWAEVASACEPVPRVIHFAGHAQPDGARLLFPASDANGVEGVEADQVAAAFTSLQRAPLLVVLNACGAANDEVASVNAFGGVVRQLVDRGVGAVVGAAVPLSDEEAVAFGVELWGKLLDGFAVDLAVQAARAALHRIPDIVEGHPRTPVWAWGFVTLTASGDCEPVFGPPAAGTGVEAAPVEAPDPDQTSGSTAAEPMELPESPPKEQETSASSGPAARDPSMAVLQPTVTTAPEQTTPIGVTTPGSDEDCRRKREASAKRLRRRSLACVAGLVAAWLVVSTASIPETARAAQIGIGAMAAAAVVTLLALGLARSEERAKGALARALASFVRNASATWLRSSGAAALMVLTGSAGHALGIGSVHLVRIGCDESVTMFVAEAEGNACAASAEVRIWAPVGDPLGSLRCRVPSGVESRPFPDRNFDAFCANPIGECTAAPPAPDRALRVLVVHRGPFGDRTSVVHRVCELRPYITLASGGRLRLDARVISRSGQQAPSLAEARTVAANIGFVPDALITVGGSSDTAAGADRSHAVVHVGPRPSAWALARAIGIAARLPTYDRTAAARSWSPMSIGDSGTPPLFSAPELVRMRWVQPREWDLEQPVELVAPTRAILRIPCEGSHALIEARAGDDSLHLLVWRDPGEAQSPAELVLDATPEPSNRLDLCRSTLDVARRSDALVLTPISEPPSRGRPRRVRLEVRHAHPDVLRRLDRIASMWPLSACAELVVSVGTSGGIVAHCECDGRSSNFVRVAASISHPERLEPWENTVFGELTSHPPRCP